MENIKQTIAGGRMILRCEICKENKVIEVTDRAGLEKRAEAFKELHGHQGESKAMKISETVSEYSDQDQAR